MVIIQYVHVFERVVIILLPMSDRDQRKRVGRTEGRREGGKGGVQGTGRSSPAEQGGCLGGDTPVTWLGGAAGDKQLHF